MLLLLRYKSISDFLACVFTYVIKQPLRVATLFVLPLYMGLAYNGLLSGFCFRSFALKFTYFKQKISLFWITC